MKKRSTLTLIMASALIATSLAGCGQPEIDDGTKIIFRCTFNDNYAAVIKKAAADFQKKYPEYRVAYDKFSGDYSQMADEVIKTASVGGHPDMTVVYPDSVANFIELGISLNVKPLIESKEVYKAGDHHRGHRTAKVQGLHPLLRRQLRTYDVISRKMRGDER